jgi:hypothetical protein
VSDVAFAALGGQRQGDALDAERRVACARRNQDLAQGRVDRCIPGNQPAAGRLAEKVGGGKDGVAGGIGVHDAAGGIDQDYAGAQAVEDVRKACRLAAL